jgi:hypothetical protein
MNAQCKVPIDEVEDGTQLIRSHNKANAHTQNASEGLRADKIYFGQCQRSL